MALHYTHHTEGKLQGFISLNTSTLENEFCRSSPHEVCRFCYARRLESFRGSLAKHLSSNTKLLSSPLDPHDLSVPGATEFIRFNGFGELTGPQHLENLYLIAAANPTRRFALWTKRDNIVDNYPGTAPKNLQIIKSWGPMNEDGHILAKWLVAHPRFDKVFVVDSVDKGQVNCQRRCRQCNWCYDGTGPSIIRELLRR